MHRYQICIEYVGTNFIGWQIQKKGNSVQKFVQSVISKIVKKEVSLVGSGRTDAGVHAWGQSAHFECEKKIINSDKFIKSLNFFLNKKQISITTLKKEIQILTHDIQQRREFMNMLLLIDLLHHPLKEIELGISGKN